MRIFFTATAMIGLLVGSAAAETPTNEFLLHVRENAPQTKHKTAENIYRGRIEVDTDFLKPVRLSHPAGNLVIGNPFIADVIPRDDRYLFLSGKSAGHTNMLVYNRAGQLVAEYMIYVRSSGQYVSLMRGAKGNAHFECMPKCERVLRIEDSPEETGELVGRISTVRSLIGGEAEKSKMSDGAAGARAAGGGGGGGGGGGYDPTANAADYSGGYGGAPGYGSGYRGVAKATNGKYQSVSEDVAR